MVGVSIRLNYTFVWTIGARAYSSTGPTRPTLYKNWAKRLSNLPKHYQDQEIPDQLKTSKSEEDFLVCQSASKHILVFATFSKFRLLATRKASGMDGTFKIVPQWYQQLFTIHDFVAAVVLEVDLNPDSIICDFETALIPVIRGYFPNTRVRGCYFQFCQEVHRKVSELGLRKKPVVRYRSDEETKRKIKMLLTTAFLPVPQVVTGVRLLETGTTGNLLDLFHYFQQGWMTDDILPLWNVHNVRIRTNNHLERWHNELNKKAGKSHVRFYELLHLLIVEQGVVETLINQLLSRDPATGCLRRLNQTYAAMQRQVMIHTGECTSGRRSLEQYLEALMYLTPELI
ncbi:hypothetical protein T11_9283 [Trichinella zimbabwensis]|uniref:MULE transposase domain-containing protein n=1 Tax=Trichinella zimbabwensis TaxID=268475 RepID=A0A0V1GRR2_9BILA|nr:hypothetical protein T11_9283 [Trichinella zimbabwensis]